MSNFDVWHEQNAKIEALTRQLNALLIAAKKAAEEIRRCDYTPARATLLVAIDAAKTEQVGGE